MVPMQFQGLLTMCFKQITKDFNLGQKWDGTNILVLTTKPSLRSGEPTSMMIKAMSVCSLTFMIVTISIHPRTLGGAMEIIECGPLATFLTEWKQKADV